MKENNLPPAFVDGFRRSSPYINAHRGRTFVIVFSGAAVDDPHFPNLIHDLALLNSLGVKLILIHGIRQQLDHHLKQKQLASQFHNGLRITDDAALVCVQQVIGMVRMQIEALLSMGLPNSPMAGARINLSGGNFITARPLGLHDGIDYCHTGEVRRIDSTGIKNSLNDNRIVLLSPIGYSPTGEIFNLCAEDMAVHVATQLHADKLLYLTDFEKMFKTDDDEIKELSIAKAKQLLRNADNFYNTVTQSYIQNAVQACAQGIRRAHLINRHWDGALLIELFTRNGIGTLITADGYDKTRQATIDDVGGIIELIEPLEQKDILVRRSRELLEMEINHFTVMERDGMIIACASLYPFEDEACAELACLAVHPDYQKEGRGDSLLSILERDAKNKQLTKLIVLTSKTAHWFIERGFLAAELDDLPVKRQAMYNYQRRSKVFIKPLYSSRS